MQSSIEEADITSAVEAYLRSHGWGILSIHYPGAHGGIGFRPVQREGLDGQGEIIPDIVARYGDIVLFVESKPEFHDGDLQKIQQLVTEPAYRPSILSKVFDNAIPTPKFLAGVAFAEVSRPRALLPDALYFCVALSGVSVLSTYPVAALPPNADLLGIIGTEDT